MTARRFFAIVPAAGQSRRMGRNKLLLPWRGAPILEHVIRAWQQSRATHLVVIVRHDDVEAQRLCRRLHAEMVSAEPPPADMKQSVQRGLRHLAATRDPREEDCWLLAPADLPALTPELIDRVIDASVEHHDVVVPRFGWRHGHPVLLPWRLSPAAFELASDEGIDRIVAKQAVRYVDLPADTAIDDVDTPEDYRRLP